MTVMDLSLIISLPGPEARDQGGEQGWALGASVGIRVWDFGKEPSAKTISPIMLSCELAHERSPGLTPTGREQEQGQRRGPPSATLHSAKDGRRQRLAWWLRRSNASYSPFTRLIHEARGNRRRTRRKVRGTRHS